MEPQYPLLQYYSKMSLGFCDTDNFCGACGVKIGGGGYREKLWMAYYQVVIVTLPEESSSEQFHLSGIGEFDPDQHDQDGYFYVPWNKKHAVEAAWFFGYTEHQIWQAEKIPRATWWSSQNCKAYPHGYPFHVSCLHLVEHYVGEGNQPNLEDLIIAVRKRWYTCSYGLEDFLPIEETSHPWIPACINVTAAATRYDWPFQADPLIIPEIWLLNERSFQNYPSSELATQLAPIKERLPFDILCIIFDLLDCSDIINYGRAQGCSIPDAYWRRRANHWVLKHEQLPDETAPNWQNICRGLERIHETSMALQNRKRIKWALDGVRVIFCETRSGCVKTSLKMFIDQTYPPFTGDMKWSDMKLNTRSAGKKFEERVARLPAP